MSKFLFSRLAAATTDLLLYSSQVYCTGSNLHAVTVLENILSVYHVDTLSYCTQRSEKWYKIVDFTRFLFYYKK